MSKILTKHFFALLIITGVLIFTAFNASAAEKTGRPVRIASLCFEKADFREILRLIDDEGARGTDVIVLPETWRGDRFVETLGGETITELSRLAKKHNTYIISPIALREGIHRYNSAVVLGRDGSIIGRYDKLFPYWGEFDLVPPVEPGLESPPVFETDFGKIGLAICFDANFPEVWQALRDKDAEIVFWPSAYSAGSQLQAYAQLHHYYIVTSTYSRDCQVFDITGQKIIDETSDRITVVRMTLDLDRGIYHENFNMDKLARLLKMHADEIEKEITMPREQWFVLKAMKPGISARSLAKEFGMEELRDYQDRSRRAIDKMRGLNYTLPKNDTHYKNVKDYVEDVPDPAYRHPSEATFEAFRDIKFGVRIHWGLYSITEQGNESWPFLKLSNEEKQAYQELYKTWNPTGFDAEEWMKLFSENGIKMFAFTSMHHEGFSMFDTKARVKKRVNWTAPGGPVLEDCDLAYSIMETPFKRDVVKELCDAAHKYGVKIDLYFSHPNWYNADFRPYNYHPCQIPDAKMHPDLYGNAVREPYITVPDPTPEEEARMMANHRLQLTELLTKYGKIDMICLDQWLGKKVWPQMRQEMIDFRKLQPEVMFRARGIGNYGDYYTPEGFIPGNPENTEMPWFVIYPYGRSFSYVKDDKYKGTKWIVNSLVDIVSKGGNFMLGIGPDGMGRFDPKVVQALKEVGSWLKINGEAIYATRPRDGELWKEGESIRFTRTKDNKTVYAISRDWPGKQLVLKTVMPQKGSDIRMLGYDKPLKWKYNSKDGLIINIPGSLQNNAERQSAPGWCFKIKV